MVKAIEQAADQQRFAGADFPRNDDESLVGPDPVEDIRQRFVVLGGAVIKLRIRCDTERILREAGFPEDVITRLAGEGVIKGRRGK